MRDSENYSLMIDLYLRGEMPVEQKTEFYRLLHENDPFAEEFKLKQSIRDHFTKVSHDEKLQLLKNIEQQEFNNSTETNQNKKLKIRRRRLFVIAAAAAAIALMISIFNPMSNSKNSNDLMLSELFEAYPSSTIKRGIQASEEEDKIKAYVLYEIGDYSKSAPLLEKIAINGDKEAYLYAGIAYLGINDYSKSINLLEKYKLTIESHLEVPDLYIAINQIMLGQSTESTKKLEELSLRSDYIGTQAKKYLKEIHK